MPTTNYQLAKTHKDVVLQKFMDGNFDGMGSNDPLNPIIYLGRTTGNTPTEIFIGGKTQTGTNNVRRLYLPESSVVLFEAYVLAFNKTDDILAVASKYVGGIKNINGTTAAVKDYETTTGGTQAFSLDPAFATVAVPLTQGLSFFSGAEAVSFAADDTNDALTVTVTGLSGKTIDWKVYLIPYVLAETSDRFYGDSAAGVGT